MPHYPKTPQTRYPTPRTVFKPRLRQVSAPPHGSATPQPKSAAEGWAGRASYAAVMDVTRYLAGYLSGKQNLMVVPDQSDHAGYSIGKRQVGEKEFYQINVPDWRGYNLPVGGFDKWRIYRQGLAHETWHSRFTPDQVYQHGHGFKEVKEKHEEEDPKTGQKKTVERTRVVETFDRLAHDVINVIEDRRVEDKGVEYHRGYVPERLYSHAYGFSLRPDVGKLWKQAEDLEQQAKQTQDKALQNVAENLKRKARYEAFLQRVIARRIKGNLPPGEQQKLEEAARYVENELEQLKDEQDTNRVYRFLSALTNNVISQLDLRGFTPERMGPQGEPGKPDEQGNYETPPPQGSSWEDTFTEEYAEESEELPEPPSKGDPKKQQEEKKQQREEKVKKDMEEFFEETKKKCDRKTREDGEVPSTEITEEDVQQAEQGSAQAAKEFQSVQQGKVEALPGELSPAVWMPVATTLPPEMFRDSKFIQDMNARLREWRQGRKQTIQEWGERLSVPGLVTTDWKKPFIHTVRQSAKGRKYLFILDFSGSMVDHQDEYKRALVSTMEVLSGIGANVAVFGFGGEAHDPNSEFFFRVKTFEQPQWLRDHSAKLAGLGANYGSTPTGRVYEDLEAYIRKHRPDATITITDGMPNGYSNADEHTERMIRQLKRHTRMVAYGIEEPKRAESIENLKKRYGDKLPRELKHMDERLREYGYHRSFTVTDVNEIPPKLIKMIAPTE